MSPSGPQRVVRLLGPPTVEVDGRPLAVDTRKAIALLAYVAVTGRPASRGELAALLWPDSGEAAARGALRRTLSVLNAALGGSGVEISRVAVGLEGAWDVDVVRFRQALSVVRAHMHADDAPCPACLAALADASALDRGEFMAGFALRDSEPFDEWQRTEAETHRRDLGSVLERLARARAARSEWGAAIDAGRRWLALDPLHEPAHRLLMTTLAGAGEQAAAIRQYRECVRLLDAELGVPPLAETTELYEAIRAGRVPAEGPAAVRAVGPARARPSAASGTEDGREHRAAGRSAAVALQFVGRERELDAMLAAWSSAGPDGRLIVVEGEPGIGKTRLLEAFGSVAAAAGATVLATRAYAGEEGIAFGPIAALVRDALATASAVERARSVPWATLRAALPVTPSLADLVEAADPADASRLAVRASAPLDAVGRARAIEAIAEVLTVVSGGDRPGVIAIDDADWADASSLEVVGFLARRLRDRPITLVLTWRPASDDAGDRRRIVLPAERDGLVTEIRLGRLTLADVAELAGRALPSAPDDELVRRLFAESEGLPLYVAEALAAGNVNGEVPRGVLDLLRARLGGVGDVAGQVLAAAAVVGRSFDFETVRAASGRSEDETVGGLEELVGRGLVVEVGAVGPEVRLDFTHGRLRDVAYADLGLVRRRVLHRRVADALRSRAAGADGDRSRWSRIAHHETEAGRFPEAADAHLRAASAARAVFANAEARRHLDAALALGPSSAETHESLGEVLVLLGDYGRAIGHLEAAAAIAGPQRQWRIERQLALVHVRLGDWDRATSHADAALDGAPDDPVVQSALLADRSAIARQVGDDRSAAAYAERALATAEAASDAVGIARASQVLAVLARARGDLDAAGALLERGLATAPPDDLDLRAAALNTLALVRAGEGDRRTAIALVEEALELCERRGDRHRQAALENNLADLLRADGRRDAAMEHLKRAVAIFAEIGGRPGVLEPEIWKLVEW
jgi:DNA-binding SARP family transcriptional activator/tetratricopeptide (TPR) repeat protein